MTKHLQPKHFSKRDFYYLRWPTHAPCTRIITRNDWVFKLLVCCSQLSLGRRCIVAIIRILNHDAVEILLYVMSVASGVIYYIVKWPTTFSWNTRTMHSIRIHLLSEGDHTSYTFIMKQTMKLDCSSSNTIQNSVSSFSYRQSASPLRWSWTVPVGRNSEEGSRCQHAVRIVPLHGESHRLVTVVQQSTPFHQKQSWLLLPWERKSV